MPGGNGFAKTEFLEVGRNETIHIERASDARFFDDAVLDLLAHPPANPGHTSQHDHETDDREALNETPALYEICEPGLHGLPPDSVKYMIDQNNQIGLWLSDLGLKSIDLGLKQTLSL